MSAVMCSTGMYIEYECSVEYESVCGTGCIQDV